MKNSLIVIRIVFVALCLVGSVLVAYSVPEWWARESYRFLAVFVGASIGLLVILIDIFLKGFSLRGLSAITFGLFVGWSMAFFISNSPLFELADQQTKFLARLTLYIVLMYLAAVMALRGRDEFNLVIPYVRFVPHGVEVPVAVVDTSALIDGRILGICTSKFMGYALVIPRFVLEELQRVADSRDPQRQARGRKGLEILNRLRELDYIDLRIHESDVDRGQSVDQKLVFLAQNLKAKLLSTDYNLAQMAEFHGVDWLNLNALAKSLNHTVEVGEVFEVDLVKEGKERGQAVGYLSDGSMVVVRDGYRLIDSRISVEAQSIIPTDAGRMIFARALASHEAM